MLRHTLSLLRFDTCLVPLCHGSAKRSFRYYPAQKEMALSHVEYTRDHYPPNHMCVFFNCKRRKTRRMHMQSSPLYYIYQDAVSNTHKNSS